MVKSMYAAVSGLKVHQSKMDVISNNIANVNTWGFKSQSASFSDSLYQNSIVGSEGLVTTGELGGTNTSQVGFGVNMSSIAVNYSTGAWSPTGRALDCMINGSGFFIVGPMPENTNGVLTGISAPNGIANLENSNLKLSKVGIFGVDSNGYLVDDQGNYVYGFQAEWTTPTGGGNSELVINNDGKNGTVPQLVPIRVPSQDPQKPIDGEQPVISTYKIGDDGTIVGTGQDEKIYTIGQIAVASVGNVNGLEHDEGYYYTPGANAGTLKGSATSSASGKILSGYLEMSNVDLAKEMSDLITTQRGYQANTKIITKRISGEYKDHYSNR